MPPAPTTVDYILLITNRDLEVVGDPIVTWTQVDVTLRLNEPGSGLFVCPAYDWVRSQMVAGNRVVVIRNGEVLISGPIESWLYERSDDGDNSGAGQITVNFADDLASIVSRIVSPDPDEAPAGWDTSNWTYTGNAELALRELVNKNAGPGALTARRLPHLVLGDLAGVGTSITVKSWLEPLGDVARRIADLGGGLGFRARQVDDEIHFEVYDPPDVSGEVRFSFGLGNVKYIGYEVVAPTATVAWVGGQGEGADRLVTERGPTAAEAEWGRFEVLVSRPGNAPTAEINEAGDEALTEGAATVRLATSLADTPDQRYGIHYGLGSRVAIEAFPATEVVDVVSTVHLQAFASSGEYVSSTVGSQAERSDPKWIRNLRAMERRVGYLERTITPATP
jgi:hypothetical protein